ncbi:MAG: Crp/Fnr family transcriptional regulator [Balneolales bacterium]
MITRHLQSDINNYPIGKDSLASYLKPEDLCRGHTCRRYKRGQIIFYEGQRPTGLFWIKEGKVKLYKTGIEGKVQITQLLNTGDVVGYRELLTNEPYTVSGATLEDALIYMIPANDFFQLLDQNPALVHNLIKALSHDLQSAELHMVNLAQSSVRERLAEALITLGNIYGYDDNMVIKVNLSREDLANIVGTATETVIRLLSELKKELIISTPGKKIRVLDERKLVKAQHAFS